MNFFKFIYRFIMGIGLLVIVIGISFLIYSYTCFNHKVEVSINEEKINIIDEEKVSYFYAYKKEALYLDVGFKENKEKEYLLAYAYSYFDEYSTIIHFFCLNDSVSITIDENGVGYLLL